jgi:hypothetical protein
MTVTLPVQELQERRRVLTTRCVQKKSMMIYKRRRPRRSPGCVEQRGRHIEAERFGGLEVDHQLVFCRRLHRQVGGLLALEDAIDITGGAAVKFVDVDPIGNEASRGNEMAISVHRGQSMPGRGRDNQLAVLHKKLVGGQRQATVRLARRPCDGASVCADFARA